MRRVGNHARKREFAANDGARIQVVLTGSFAQFVESDPTVGIAGEDKGLPGIRKRLEFDDMRRVQTNLRKRLSPYRFNGRPARVVVRPTKDLAALVAC